MGEPITRLNPKIESQIQKILLSWATQFLFSVCMFFSAKHDKKRGRKPLDYRIILVLCILRILLRKSYADYEIEMRTDLRICHILGLKILPGKSTIQRGMRLLNMKILREFNCLLLKEHLARKLNLLLDASGIRIVGRSVWFSLRVKRYISRRECDKVHLAICSDLLLIMNWFITNGKKHDSPFFQRLLKHFKFIGVILADLGYLARKNFQFVVDRKGALFIPFKSNSTAKPKSKPAWKFSFNLWKKLNTIYMSIYHQRSKIEAVFSALKKRYGDELYCKKYYMRRREMALRFIAYNLRILICIVYANKNNLPLYVRAKK